MTEAQKIAKVKFKQAIAYRQKTGVSLKEAFAHIYGKKKVSGTGNSYIFKVYDRNSFGDPINNSFRKVTINASNQTDAKDKLYKKYPSSKYFCELQDSYTNINKKIGKIKKYTKLKLENLANDYAYATGSDLDKVTWRLLDKDYTNKLIPVYEKAIKDKNKLNKKSTKMPIKKSAPKKKIAKKVVHKIVKKAATKKVAKKKLTKQDYDKRYQAKKPGKRLTKWGTTYYENRENRSDKGKLLGFNDITLTRINNDLNGNPRYVVHFLNVLNSEEQSFLPFSKKYEYALKKAKLIGGKKYDNKQYGGGIVFGSIFNSESLKQKINNLMQTTPKIKY